MRFSEGPMALDKRLIDLIGGNKSSTFFDPAPPSPYSPLDSLFGSLAQPPAPPANSFESLFIPPSPPVVDIARALYPHLPSTSTRPVAPLVAPRRVYFAFDFDDVIRVNNVRQTGKIGPRVMGNSRGFLDRSVWEASKAFTDRGLKEMMQRMSKFSSVVCVLIGSNTWYSRWVRYEIALAVINERGLIAIDLNSINHNIRKVPDPLGANPLSFMGLHKDANGSWYLVEKKPVDLDNGEIELRWHWYEDYQQRLLSKPKYVPDIPVGGVVPLSSYTKRYDFTNNAGSVNIPSWLDASAIEAGR